jgi:hypothetical protein
MESGRKWKIAPAVAAALRAALNWQPPLSRLSTFEEEQKNSVAAGL